MNELIARLAAKASVDSAVAEKTAGALLGFLRDQGPTDQIQVLTDAIPGAKVAIEAADTSGGISRLMGGGMMALGTRLFGYGLDMSQIRIVVRELFEYCRDKIGTDRTHAIAGGIPALSYFA